MDVICETSLGERCLCEVGLDSDVPDPGPHVAGVLDDLVDELLLGVAPDRRRARSSLALLAPGLVFSDAMRLMNFFYELFKPAKF